MSLATSFFQSWSRGVGANLLAANEGMGLMHTGSGIFSSACHSHGRFHRPLVFLPVKVSRALLATSPQCLLPLLKFQRPTLRPAAERCGCLCAEGEALASAWEPTNPHDEALLIATVPKLHGKSTPMYAGGKPPAQPWCGATFCSRLHAAAGCLCRLHCQV